ncbi:hypothetical protein HZA97_06150 [Candidatus Woesearchaeota archaeon]|nr:hypothetical protein [Candidatus Woesearchaeota archaeon]
MCLLTKIKNYFGFGGKSKIEEKSTDIPVKTPDNSTKPVDVSNVTLDSLISSESSYLAVPLSDFYGLKWKFFIPTNDYLKFKVQKHKNIPIKDFVYFVTYNHPEIKKIADHLVKNIKGDPAQIFLDFVHSLVIYDVTIEKESDYVRYPLETLVERNGDCEDFSILAAALMKSAGVDVALIYIPKENNENAHMALGICGNYSGTYYEFNEKKYYFAEAAGTEWLNGPSKWRIGEMPEKYKKIKVNLYVVP